MSTLRMIEQPPASHAAEEQLLHLYQITETFRSIALAWESLATNTWSAASVKSFAALARYHALELSALGCSALDQAVVELVLALEAITVAGVVVPPQIERVDYALAHIRAVCVQRMLAAALPTIAVTGESAPVMCVERCARCATTGLCAIVNARSA